MVIIRWAWESTPLHTRWNTSLSWMITITDRRHHHHHHDVHQHYRRRHHHNDLIWIYVMMTSSNGNVFRVSPVTGEFPAQRPVTRSFDDFFHLHLNEWLSKHWWDWWYKTPSRLLWRHCNAYIYCTSHQTNASNLIRQSQKVPTDLTRVLMPYCFVMPYWFLIRARTWARLKHLIS